MLSNSVQSLLLKSNVSLGTTTPVSEVEALISRLRPVALNDKLIRLGGSSDGGYVLPDLLDGVEYCFSPGVDKSVRFELDLAERGIRSFLADYSIDKIPVQHEMLEFRKLYLAALTNDIEISLADWIDESVPVDAGNLLLQMDIEESEYDVLMSTPRSVLSRFRIVIVEFHSLQKIFDRFAFRVIRRAFENLLRDFAVVHIHPNNCCGSLRRDGVEVPKALEMTFLRRDCVVPSNQPYELPSNLDEDCVPSNKTLELPAMWWQS